MEKNPYTLAKLGLESNATPRPPRDCGFYAKYVFLFLSLIQFLIILGLVLFMVYGNNHAATEKHLQGMSIWLQECRVQTEALGKEKANLTSLLNASRAESRQVAGQLSRLNGTFRACSADKMRFQGQLRQADAMNQNLQKCYDIVSYFNATYPDKVKALEVMLKAQALQADVEKKNLDQENQLLKAQVKATEHEVAACQLEVLQFKTQVRKMEELQGQVRSEIQAASKDMKAAVKTALPSESIWSCNTEEVRTLQTTCNNLSKQLDGYVAALGQRLEDRVYAVAKENGLLQREKAACAQDKQELSNKLTAQTERAAQEKATLQLACNTEKTQIYAEQQKLFGEKESLRQELDRTKKNCWVPPPPNPAMRMPGASGGTNPLANVPGNFNLAPNAFNPHWPRTGVQLSPPRAVSDLGLHGILPAQRNSAPLGNIGFHRTSSHTGHAKPEEDKKPLGAGAISLDQPSLKPAGHPS